MTEQELSELIARLRVIELARTPGIWHAQIAKAQFVDPLTDELLVDVVTTSDGVNTINSIGSDWGSQLLIAPDDIMFINAASAHFSQLMDVIEEQQAEFERQQQQIARLEDSRYRYYNMLKELRNHDGLSADDEDTFDRLGME